MGGRHDIIGWNWLVSNLHEHTSYFVLQENKHEDMKHKLYLNFNKSVLNLLKVFQVLNPLVLITATSCLRFWKRSSLDLVIKGDLSDCLMVLSVVIDSFKVAHWHFFVLSKMSVV